MTLLQRISRNARNVLLLCPRSLRAGGRRRGFNIVFFTIFFITFTFYITVRNTQSLQGPVDTIKLEKRANVLLQVTSTSRPTSAAESATKKTEMQRKVSEVTRMVLAAPEEKLESQEPQEVTTVKKTTKIPLKNCTKRSPKLVGDMNSNPNITPSMEKVEKYVGPDVQMGGCYSPTHCKALQKVAIIIPFKDRDAHLKTLLYHLHPMLMRQKLHYCVYVAEQYDNGQFNKATVMNAAFEEVLKLDNYDCIILHDVDMIPENDKNFYMCADQPRHLSPAIDKFQYKPHYGTDFGGVTGITPEQYRKANGHSNRFWGWGGEDNDMEFRIQYRNMSIIPSSLKIGRYKMIPHLHPWKFSPNKYPWKMNNTRKSRADTDGLSDLQYRLVDTIRHPMYTKLMLDIRRVEVTKLTLYIDGKSTMDIDLYPGECRYEEFPGKYLDFVIELTDKKEAQDLPLWPALKSGSSKSSLLKNNLVGPDGKRRRFSMLHDLKQAQDLCDKLVPECAGVERENAQENYSLRRGGMPRHLVISGPAVPRPPTVPPDKDNNERLSAERRRYILPEKMAYMRYCPGEFSHFRPYKKPFMCVAEETCKHTYSFEIQFSLIKPILGEIQETYANADEIDPTKCRWEIYPNMTLEKHDRIDDSEHSHDNLTSALEACENMRALCGGVVNEAGGEEFTLRKKGPPKHSDQELMRLLLGNRDVKLFGALGNDLRLAWVKLRKQAATGDFTMNRDGKQQLQSDTHVVLDPGDHVSSSGTYNIPTLEEVLAKNTTAHVKYCPGFYGAHQSLPSALKQAVDKNVTNWVDEHDGKQFRHFFAFKLDIKVLMNPAEYLYYTDDKHFESHLEKGENHYTFTWPNGKAPNFSDPNIATKYSFRTPDFAVPNIPGTYAVESKVVDRHRQPYFQWNWWFEVTSGDKQLDAQTRDAYWKKKMTENVLKGRAQQHHEMMREKAERAKKNKIEYERKMSELKKKPRQPMPPHIQKMVDKVQKAYDKHDTEGDPVADIDPNAPEFQKEVGHIKVVQDEGQPKPKPRSTTPATTTKKMVRLSTILSKFHIGLPPQNPKLNKQKPVAA